MSKLSKKVLCVGPLADEASVYCFHVVVAREGCRGSLRRVYPPGFRRGDEAACAELACMRAWFERLKITHVTSKFGNKETDECCIADGTYTAKQYLKWWGRLEKGMES